MTKRLPNSLGEAADLIGCGYGTLWRLYRKGEVKTQTVNNIPRVLPGEIERLRPLIGKPAKRAPTWTWDDIVRSNEE
jgi:hypothetical protein